MMNSLWGDDFVVQSEPQQVKKAIKKINQPKDPNRAVEQALKSKKTTIYERLTLIKENVNKILGRYALNTQIIKSKEEYISYIDKAIQNGIIAVDTETNNSLEPLTCKIMGLCLYTPGQKAAYIPINHKDVDTDERFSWQLTEQEIAGELLRLSDTKIIMHNGKFDYEVIKCTTGVQLKIFWDTLIGAKVLDENERSAGLKQQYIEKIDNTIEKYSIEHLFKDVEYAYVEPEIFALYAATDAFLTYGLYEYQHDKLYGYSETDVEFFGNTITMDLDCMVQTPSGYVMAYDLCEGDVICNTNRELLKINKKTIKFNKVELIVLLN